MKILLLIAFFSFKVLGFEGLEHYPEDRIYTSEDRGLAPYRALSLYKTGAFSLTFDDGPHPDRTPRILDILKRFDVKATFFVVTSNLNENTLPILKRILQEGHLIGSHSPTHARSRDLSEKEWKEQTKKSFLDLGHWMGRAGFPLDKLFYRFPYGDYGTRSDYHHINALKEVSQELFQENCIHMAFWDIDTADWVPGMTGAEVAQNIIAHHEGGTFMNFKKEGNRYVKIPVTITHPPGGGVILQHDVQESSVQGLALFLEYAHERGIKLPRLDEVEEFKVTKSCRLIIHKELQ